MALLLHFYTNMNCWNLWRALTFHFSKLLHLARSNTNWNAEICPVCCLFFFAAQWFFLPNYTLWMKMDWDCRFSSIQAANELFSKPSFAIRFNLHSGAFYRILFRYQCCLWANRCSVDCSDVLPGRVEFLSLSLRFSGREPEIQRLTNFYERFRLPPFFLALLDNGQVQPPPIPRRFTLHRGLPEVGEPGKFRSDTPPSCLSWRLKKFCEHPAPPPKVNVGWSFVRWWVHGSLFRCFKSITTHNPTLTNVGVDVGSSKQWAGAR